MGAVLNKLTSQGALTSGAGGGAGAFLSTVTFYPVELVTTRMQASSGSDGYQYAGMTDALMSILRAKGIGGLYTGFIPVIYRSVAFDFTMPYFYAILADSYADVFLEAPGVLIGLMLRTIAGQCNAVVNSPLETITNRLMASRASSNNGVLQICHAIVAEGGIFNFWAGLGTSLILAINPALTFATFDWLKNFVSERIAPGAVDTVKLSAQSLMLLGVIAKAMTLCVVYPLMRAKVLLQTRTGGTLLGTLRDVAMSEGYTGLYKGMSAKFSKSLGSTALLLTTKDLTERWLKKVMRRPRRPQLVVAEDDIRYTGDPWDSSVPVMSAGELACTVRPVAAGDEVLLAKLGREGLSVRSRALFGPYNWDSEGLTDELKAAVQTSLSRRDLHLVALDHNSAPVGYAFLWAASDDIPELGLAVVDAWQGRGLGSVLLRLLEQAGKALRKPAIELTTMQDNQRALSVYLRAGYEQLGLIHNPVGCDVTAAFEGRAKPTSIVVEHQLAIMLDEARRAATLAHLDAKRERAAQLFPV